MNFIIFTRIIQNWLVVWNIFYFLYGIILHIEELKFFKMVIAPPTRIGLRENLQESHGFLHVFTIPYGIKNWRFSLKPIQWVYPWSTRWHPPIPLSDAIATRPSRSAGARLPLESKVICIKDTSEIIGIFRIHWNTLDAWNMHFFCIVWRMLKGTM